MKYYQTSKTPRETTYYMVDGNAVIRLREYKTAKYLTVYVSTGPDAKSAFQSLLKAKQLKELSLSSFLEEYNRWLRGANFQKGGGHE